MNKLQRLIGRLRAKRTPKSDLKSIRRRYRTGHPNSRKWSENTPNG